MEGAGLQKSELTAVMRCGGLLFPPPRLCHPHDAGFQYPLTLAIQAGVGCGACIIQLSSWMKRGRRRDSACGLVRGQGSGQAVQPRPPLFSGHHGVRTSRSRVGKAPSSRIQVKAVGSVLLSPPVEFGCFKIVAGCFRSLLKGAAGLWVNLS